MGLLFLWLFGGVVMVVFKIPSANCQPGKTLAPFLAGQVRIVAI